MQEPCARPFRLLTGGLSFGDFALVGPRGDLMTYRFLGFELDEQRRELRLNGREIELQPRVFALLAYLVANRDRTVAKDELMDALWPGVIVTEGSLQRAVSLARAALRQGGAGNAIRTFARHGYRFDAELDSGAGEPSDEPLAPAVERARRAHARGEWEAAVTAFRAADDEGGLAARDLEQLAHAVQCLGRPTGAVAPLERAVAAHASVGDLVGAARAALSIALIRFEHREPAVALGWHRRASRYLEGEEESREHGYLAWLAGRMALAEGDVEAATRHAELAHDIARRLGDAEIEALALCCLGLAAIACGEIREGLSMQDEAAASVLSGEVSPLAGGLVYCGVIWGCRNLLDWRRAAQWTEQFTRWCAERGATLFQPQCRLHRAEILCVRSDLAGAEQAVDEACEELPATAPWAEGEAYRVLGDIRLARGDLDGAEDAFRRAYELGWSPQPGHALVRLARDDVDGALRGLEQALEAQDWSNRQRRGLLLANLTIVAALAGEEERAREALEELDAQPALWSTPGLAALMARAWAEVAFLEGLDAEGVSSLRHAIEIWQEAGSPLGAAGVRMRLAEVLSREGDLAGAELELAAAKAAFEKAGATPLVEKCQAARRAFESARN